MNKEMDFYIILLITYLGIIIGLAGLAILNMHLGTIVIVFTIIGMGLIMIFVFFKKIYSFIQAKLKH
jgi:hypothetical protein